MSAINHRLSWDHRENASGYEVCVERGNRKKALVRIFENTIHEVPIPLDYELQNFYIRSFVMEDGAPHYLDEQQGILSEGMIETVLVIKKLDARDEGIVLNWESMEYADMYAVFRKTEGERYRKVGETTDLKFVDSEVKNDVDYTYMVRAMRNQRFISLYDREGSTIRRVDPPELKKVIEKNGTNIVFWDKVPGVEMYCVYRKTRGRSWKFVGRETENFYVDRRMNASSEDYIYTVRCASPDGKNLISGHDKMGIRK